MLLHFALVLQFAVIFIAFCVNVAFCGDYYILRRNTCSVLQSVYYIGCIIYLWI